MNKPSAFQIGSETNPLPPGTRVWNYLRYSLGDNQTMDSQISAVQNYCKEHGWIIDRVFRDDATSGRNAEDREGFMLMVSQSKLNPKTAKAIVMWDTKRFSRGEAWETQFYRSMLRKNGWRLIFIQDNIPDDPILAPLMEVILDIMAHQQLFDIKAGTIRGLRYIAEQGCLPNGRPAIGFQCNEVPLGGRKKDGTPRVGKKPVVDPDIAPLIIRAFELKARGAPYQVIKSETGLFHKDGLKKIENQGSHTNTKKRFNPISGSWSHLFRNRAYIGEYVFHGEVFKDIYPAIISNELFDTVQALIPPDKISQRKISDHPQRKHSKYVLTGFSFCGYCHAPMEGKSTKGRSNCNEISSGEKNENDLHQHRYYVCSKHNETPDICPQSGFINAEDIEGQVFQIITNDILKDEYLSDLLKWTNDELNIESEALVIRINELHNRLTIESHINQKMHRNYLLFDKPTKGAIEELYVQDALVEKMRTELFQLEELFKNSHVDSSPEEIQEFISNAIGLLETENLFDLKAIYERLVDKIEMYNDRCLISIHYPTS